MRDPNRENFGQRPEEPSSNNVMITVLVESSPRSRVGNRKVGSTSQFEPNPPQIRKMRRRTKRGYDRRAELLAHARELRGVEAGRVQSGPTKNSRPKSKKWTWASRVPVKIRSTWSLGAFRWKNREWRYERLTEEKEASIKKQSSSGRSSSSEFCRKFKKFLIRLSCGLKCYGQ